MRTRGPIRGMTVGVAALLLAVVGGCGIEADSDAASAAPVRLPPAGAPPAGTHRFTCSVDSAHGRITMALDLPRGFQPGDPDEYSSPGPGGFCVWQHDVTARDESGPYQETVVVTLTGRSSRQQLQKSYDEEKRDLVGKGDTQTDDSVLALTLRRGVPTYGGISGDRLDDWCYCDGQNTINRSVVADGVELGYGSVHSLTEETDREVGAILATAGVVHSGH